MNSNEHNAFDKLLWWARQRLNERMKRIILCAYHRISDYWCVYGEDMRVLIKEANLYLQILQIAECERESVYVPFPEDFHLTMKELRKQGKHINGESLLEEYKKRLPVTPVYEDGFHRVVLDPETVIVRKAIKKAPRQGELTGKQNNKGVKKGSKLT